MVKRVLSGLLVMSLVLGGAALSEADNAKGGEGIAITASAADGVAINSTNFPDANFRSYVSENFDTDGDGSLSQSEIDAVTEIYCINRGIQSLEGIEYFTELTSLECFYNELTSLDLSENIALTYLDCNYSQLVNLNISNNTALKHLECYNNRLTSLDVSNNTALKYLDCGLNKLPSLDISNNIEIEYLNCYGNELTSLDVSNNTALIGLYCHVNELTSLDVSNTTALVILNCLGNELTSLDISNSTELGTLVCNENQLTSLDVSKNTALTHLECYGNQLTRLDVSKNTTLGTLVCNENQLTSLDLSKNTKLTYLHCDNNQLANLDVGKNTSLEFLYCDNNQLTSLDLSKNTKLEELFCNGNKITSLNISNNPYLLKVYLNPYEIHYGSPDIICYVSENYLQSLWVDRSTKIITESTTPTLAQVKSKTEYTNATDAIRVNWNKVTGAEGYIVERSTDGKTWTRVARIANANTLNYRNAGLKSGTKYLYRVKAFVIENGVAYYSDYSSTITAWTKPAAPKAKTEYTYATDAVRVNWNKSTGAEGYIVERSTDGKTWTRVARIANANTLNYRNSGLKSGTKYLYRVKAFTIKNGMVSYSPYSATITAATKPAATKITKNTKAATAVRLYWNKVNCTGYKIQQYKNGSWLTIKKVAMGTTEYKVTGLKKNTSYKFRIQPYYSVNGKILYGAVSATYTAKTTS